MEQKHEINLNKYYQPKITKMLTGTFLFVDLFSSLKWHARYIILFEVSQILRWFYFWYLSTKTWKSLILFSEIKESFLMTTVHEELLNIHDYNRIRRPFRFYILHLNHLSFLLVTKKNYVRNKYTRTDVEFLLILLIEKLLRERLE